MKEARLVNARGDAWQENALEITLHNRGQAVEPDWKHEDERFGFLQAMDVGFDSARIRARVDVVEETSRDMTGSNFSA